MKRLSSIFLTVIIATTASMSYANEDIAKNQIKKTLADKAANNGVNKSEPIVTSNANQQNVCRDLKFGGLARTTSLKTNRGEREHLKADGSRMYEDENGRVNLYLQAVDMVEDLFFESVAANNKKDAYKTSYISKLNTSLCEEPQAQERIVQL